MEPSYYSWELHSMQDDETALLQQALAMSMAEAAAAAAAAGASSGDVPMVGSGGDDQDLAFGMYI